VPDSKKSPPRGKESRVVPFYQVASAARGAGTDANPMQLSRGGIAAGLLSVQQRYMHAPNELLSLEDLENSAAMKTVPFFFHPATH
jgi:putative aminopeptidase FrvX